MDCNIQIYGGNSYDITRLQSAKSLTAIYEEFQKDMSPDVAAALPISYKLKYISSGADAKILLTTDTTYYKVRCSRYTQLKLQLDSVQFVDKAGKYIAGGKWNDISLNKIEIDLTHFGILPSGDTIDDPDLEGIGTKNNNGKISYSGMIKFNSDGVCDFSGITNGRTAYITIDNMYFNKAIRDEIKVKLALDVKTEKDINLASSFKILWQTITGKSSVDDIVDSNNNYVSEYTCTPEGKNNKFSELDKFTMYYGSTEGTSFNITFSCWEIGLNKE